MLNSKRVRVPMDLARLSALLASAACSAQAPLTSDSSASDLTSGGVVENRCYVSEPGSITKLTVVTVPGSARRIATLQVDTAVDGLAHEESYAVTRSVPSPDATDYAADGFQLSIAGSSHSALLRRGARETTLQCLPSPPEDLAALFDDPAATAPAPVDLYGWASGACTREGDHGWQRVGVLYGAMGPELVQPSLFVGWSSDPATVSAWQTLTDPQKASIVRAYDAVAASIAEDGEPVLDASGGFLRKTTRYRSNWGSDHDVVVELRFKRSGDSLLVRQLEGSPLAVTHHCRLR